MPSSVIPILKDDPKGLEAAERSQLIDLLDHYRAMGNEWMRRQIIDRNRIDILAIGVLGYKVQPFHMRMLRWQFQHPDNLQLVFRGAGKTTVCTVTKAVHLLVKNPNLRLVLASKTAGNSEAFLKEIKGHFENNARFVELFGEYYDPGRVGKWDTREIDVLPKTKHTKEASITCVGVDGTIVSKHYDVEFSDDLVDEENSRTKYMRDKTRTWYYQTFDPCIEPPDSTVPHRGERHRLGTRYHYDDIYGHWMGNELEAHTQIIPALNDEGKSPWPEKYPPTWFEDKRKNSGTIIFNAQYKCDTEAMKGEIFQYDDCQVIDDKDIPNDLQKFGGIDLAISEKESADHFAMLMLGVDKMKNYYVLDFEEGQFRFGEQTKKILAFHKKHDPVRMGIETNAYQASQYQTLKDVDPNVRLKAITTDKDKITRAWKLSAIFENKRMFFRKNMGPVIDQLVLFPSFRYKDLFDALDMAVTASRIKTRRVRENEPGLI